MLSWRSIPTTEYGNWGGAKNTGDFDFGELPIDQLDWAFFIHDYLLKRGYGRYADYLLVRMLKICKDTQGYARFYRRMAIIIFSITGKKRRVKNEKK